MAEPAPAQDRFTQQSAQVTPAVHRKITVRGSGGVAATIIVIARQGRVLLSVMPPFTWEAILEPRQIAELTHTLELARDDAEKMTPPKQTSHQDLGKES